MHTVNYLHKGRVRGSSSVVVLIVSLLAADWAMASSFDIGVGGGVGMLVGPKNGDMEGQAYGTAGLVLSIGYDFGPAAIFLEGMYAFGFEGQLSGVHILGAIGGRIECLSSDPLRVYVLVSTGYGLVYFRENDGESVGGSGAYQVQLGAGMSFEILDWLSLFSETRLRIGFPYSPEVVTLYQQFGLLFRI